MLPAPEPRSVRLVPLDSYLPIVLVLAVSGTFGLLILAVASFLGPKRLSPAKLAPFECGNPPIGSARRRFSVNFYLVALLFIVFDLEMAFFYPWAVLLKELGWFGFLEMLLFALTLLVGLVYVWKRGGLDWEEPAGSAPRVAEGGER